jgi:hypothetical protein
VLALEPKDIKTAAMEDIMFARIYQPAKTAMSSGTAKAKLWVLEFAHSEARRIDPLMGWTSSDDTQTQVRLQFDTKDAAVGLCGTSRYSSHDCGAAKAGNKYTSWRLWGKFRHKSSWCMDPLGFCPISVGKSPPSPVGALSQKCN